MAASSSEESNENPRNSRAVLGDLFSELHLDFCAGDFANYMKIDVSSQVEKGLTPGECIKIIKCHGAMRLAI